MPSSFSNNLKIELINTGEQDGTWGATTNTNFGTALEQAIVGRAIVTFPSDADYTLPYVPSNGSQQARCVYLVVQGAISASRNLIVPTIYKNYVVKNDTTGSQDIVVKTSAGTGITIPHGKTTVLYVNGTNVIQEFGYIETLEVNTLTSGNASFTGTPTAPTAAPGTNTTQIATTAFVQASTSTLGTMSTQNANSVNITGGSIAGITDLAVADGGTGASSITANSVILGNGSNALSGNLVAPSTSGNVLTSNGTTWTSAALALSDSNIPNVTAGTNYFPIAVEPFGFGGVSSSSATKVSSARVLRTGTYNFRIRMQYNSGSGTQTIYSRIYANGVALGSEQSDSLAVSAYATQTHSNISLTRGDIVQLYIRISSGTVAAYAWQAGVNETIGFLPISSGTSGDSFTATYGLPL